MINSRPLLNLAAGNGDAEIVRSFLDYSADVNGRDSRGRTALMKAVEPYRGHQPVVQLLLEHGADVNAADEHGETALIIASGGGHAAIVESLIAAGADVNAVGHSTALYSATGFGHVDVVRLLLKHHADVTIRHGSGETPLERAQMQGHTEIVRLLRRAPKRRENAEWRRLSRR